MPVQQREDGVLVAVSGASRSGKTESVKRETAKHPRVLVWDVRREYLAQGFDSASDRETLLKLTGSKQRARIAFHPPGVMSADFEYFCRVAMLWGQLWPCTVIVDELAEITHPGKAPPAWHKLITQGSHWGIWIYGITQSPAESDKTIWRNAHVLRAFQQTADSDRQYMAKRMGVSPDQIPNQPLEWVQRDRRISATAADPAANLSGGLITF